MPDGPVRLTRNNKISALIARLGCPETSAAEQAGRQLIRMGVEALPLLLRATRDSSLSVRRRVAFVLGELSPSDAQSQSKIEEVLQTALDDADWKVRRNAAVGLGKIARHTSLTRISEKLRGEADERVRPSLILAFGAVADPSDAAILHSVRLISDKERAAAAKVFDRLRGLAGTAGTIETATVIDASVRVELWSRGGIAEITAEEVEERGIPAEIINNDRVRILTPTSLDELVSFRTALFPVLVFESPATDPAQLAQGFSASPIVNEMIRLTPGEMPRFRLTLQHVPPGWTRKRDWISAFAANCASMANAAAGYSWEIIVKQAQRHSIIGARPATYTDKRFFYRHADVPASLHPTLAAAAVRLCPVRDDDVVLDPFCGSGTLLAERAIRGPYRRLIAVDISPRALKAARENLAGFDKMSFIQADATTLSLREQVNAIISNPPYGQRVGAPRSASKLHAALDALALRVLCKRGFLIVFRPLTFPDPAGLQLVAKRTVDAGGIQVSLIVARKSGSAVSH